MIKKIEIVAEAAGLNDINTDWKIVAKRHIRSVAGEVAAVWEYCGSLSDSKEQVAFRKLAFAAGRKENAHISCVTGRDPAGALCLYARVYPQGLRPVRDRAGYA